MLRGAIAHSGHSPACSWSKFSRRFYSGEGSPSSITSLLYPPNQSSSGGTLHTPITVQGFVRSIRRQKNIAFVALGDGTTLNSLQVVLSPELANGYVFDLHTM
jgi:hypothetical protein